MFDFSEEKNTIVKMLIRIRERGGGGLLATDTKYFSGGFWGQLI